MDRLLVQCRRATLASALLVATLAAPLSENWRERLQRQLEGHYPPSQIGFKGSLKRQAEVVILQVDGIQAVPESALVLPTNQFEHDKLAVTGTFLSSFDSSRTAGRNKNRLLEAGQKLYVQSIAVKDSEVKFIVFTADQKEAQILGTTRARYLKAAIAFKFHDGLESARFDDVAATIGKVLLTQTAASAPKSIRVGQTESEVERVLGPSERIVDLGNKKIYIYKDLKVVFIEGRVADVQ